MHRSAAALAWLAAVLFAPSVSAEPAPWTEAEVIRLARTGDPRVLRAQAATTLAASRTLSASLYPNPSLYWTREALPSGASESNDSLYLTVPVDLGKRRGAERALGEADTWSARATRARTESEAVLEALHAFYASLHAERSVTIATVAVTRLEEAARVVGRQTAEGAASGYELARVEIARELAKSRLATARARETASRATLHAMLGAGDATHPLRGELRAPRRTAEPGPRRSVGPRFVPSVQAEYAALTSAREASRAASWGWFPAISATGGLRVFDSTATRYGYYIGLSIGVPLFSRGQDLISEAEAREGVARADAHARERQLQVAQATAEPTWIAANDEALRLAAETEARVTVVERAAVSGYREGQRSVLELLDAERTRSEVEQARLDLEWTARRAEIELRAARGEFER